jgi:hypothetical protein
MRHWRNHSLLLDGVFQVLAGLLQVTERLIGAALRFEHLVTRDASFNLFNLALGNLGGVLSLHLLTHSVIISLVLRGVSLVLPSSCDAKISNFSVIDAGASHFLV